MAGDAVQLVQQDEPADGEILVIVVAAVETLEPDDEGIIDRLCMGRMPRRPLCRNWNQNQEKRYPT